MSKETEYRAQLEALGIWDEAFAPALHQLCILERELSRAMKQWKATAEPGEAPSVLDEHYDQIQKLRRDILANRDSLGLTPKSYLKLKKAMPAEDTPEASTGNAAMAAILDRFRSDASAPAPAYPAPAPASAVSPAPAAAVSPAPASAVSPFASPAPAYPASAAAASLASASLDAPAYPASAAAVSPARASASSPFASPAPASPSPSPSPEAQP